MAEGGKGGNAKVGGNRSRAVGGPGGDAGDGAGRGGDGGSAEVHGDDAFAQGGAGGNAGTADGRGGRRAKGGAELANARTELWGFGCGGAGGNAPEYNRRLGLLRRYRQEYSRTFPQDAPFIEAGVDPVPINWINKRLEEEGETWQVEMRDGGYILPPLR